MPSGVVASTGLRQTLELRAPFLADLPAAVEVDQSASTGGLRTLLFRNKRWGLSRGLGGVLMAVAQLTQGVSVCPPG